MQPDGVQIGRAAFFVRGMSQKERGVDTTLVSALPTPLLLLPAYTLF